MLNAGVGSIVNISSIVVFLASDEASFVTGTKHIIEGGMTAI